MKNSRVAPVCALFLAASLHTAHGGPMPPASPAAVALVKAMNFDAFVAEAAAPGVRKGRAEGLIDAAQFNCLILQPGQWTDDVARHFARSLSVPSLRADPEVNRMPPRSLL